MNTISIPVQYLAMDGETLDERIESNIRHTHRTWEIDPSTAALVLVDFWTTHIIASHLERCTRIVEKTIAPLLPVARDAGFTIIHAPGNGTAQKYHEHPGYMGEPPESDGQGATGAKAGGTRRPRPGKAKPEPDWPPKEARERSGEFAAYRRTFLDRKSDKVAQKLFHSRRIPRVVEPAEEDYVVVTGAQLHELLRDLRIVHLFYLGFATNDCVLYKDYGVRAMGGRGYNIILLRDCTTGIEDTVGFRGFAATKAAVRFIELHHVSATSSDLIAACAAGS